MRLLAAALFLPLLFDDASSFSPTLLQQPGGKVTWTSIRQRMHPSRTTALRTRTYMANNNILNSLTSFFPPNQPTTAATPASSNPVVDNPAVQLLEALNTGNIDAALDLISVDDCEWDDCNFYNSCVGKDAIERRFRLIAETASFQQEQFVVNDVTMDDNGRNTIGVLFHKETSDGTVVAKSRGCAMFQLDPANRNNIKRVCLLNEPDTRGGENGLKILSGASRIMTATGYNPEVGKSSTSAATKSVTSQQQQQQQQLSLRVVNPAARMSPPEQYFDAWNRRDMMAAVGVFADKVQYEDTAFPIPFVGKLALETHLVKCAAAFPSNFQIVIDTVALDSNTKSAACEWHFENDGEALPFTQGCSYYTLDATGKLIVEGIDFIEPAVIKPAGLALFADSLLTKLRQEPVRWIPVVSWLAYMYIVFFSDGILPGANALQLEARTWEEVLNLSLNFFLVSPLLNLPFSPSVHPMLEGVFNLLLSWAAMFAGFLSDDRKNKPNLLPMFPIVVGMQFLTSAFLLPYLAVRSSESSATSGSVGVAKDELPVVAQIAGESRGLPALMGVVGSGSILWFFLGRAQEYGTEFSVRYASFVDLLSIDRVGSSFVVDLAIFAIFQGWFVEDDLKRRGVQDGGGLLEVAGKYIPFFGMAAYLLWRPSLPETRDDGPV